MTEKEYMDKADMAISELVREKTELQKAYNYYNGVRDKELFQYLEENFGIGNPTSVEFTPLLKKHIDALVGEFLGTPILPKITCKDSNTISNITREKHLKLTSEVVKFLKNHLQNSILQIINQRDVTDVHIKEQLDDLIRSLDQSFVSQYEIAAQNVLDYIMQSRHTDIITKLRQLLIDLLVTGYTFFRVKPSLNNSNIEIEVLNPLNTFIDRNFDSPYVKDSYRSVVRYYMTKNQILAKYKLSNSDKNKLKEAWEDSSSNYYSTYIDSCEIITHHESPQSEFNINLIPVYDVEWLETDSKGVMHRYNVIRITDDIYIINDDDLDVIRSVDNYNYCSLSVNGVYFLNRSYQPYSLILKCAHLLDRYDLLIYYRDKLIANSGSVGQIIDMPLIPTSLGVDFPERVLKWLAYRKQGTLLIDSSQEGDNSTLNTIFNGFDDTIKAQAIQAIEIAIQSVEQTTSSITGVFRERLNGIELRDAVSNIKQGLTNSFVVTKHYFQQMDLIICEVLLACLNQAKITFKNGLTGTLILGDKYQKVFTALPEHFTLTDYDVHVTASSEIMQDIQNMQSIIPEFIKTGALSPDIILEAVSSKSLTDLKYKVKHAMQVLKEENNKIMQLSQQLEETTLKAQQLEKTLQQAQQKIQQLDESRLKLEQEKIQLDYQVGWFKAQTERSYKERSVAVEEKRTEVEVAQLKDGNPYNDQIRNL